LLKQKYKVAVTKCQQCKIGQLQEKEKIPGEWQKPKLYQQKIMKGKELKQHIIKTKKKLQKVVTEN